MSSPIKDLAMKVIEDSKDWEFAYKFRMGKDWEPDSLRVARACLVMAEALAFYEARENWSARMRNRSDGDPEWLQKARDGYYVDPAETPVVKDFGMKASDAIDQANKICAGRFQ